MGGEPGGDNLLVTFGAAAGLASFSSQSMCQAQGCPLTESPVSVVEMARMGPGPSGCGRPRTCRRQAVP